MDETDSIQSIRRSGLLAGLVWFALMTALMSLPAYGVERFPPPDFQSGYHHPETYQTPPKSMFREYLDVGALVAALAVSSWLSLRKRSRTGLMALGIVSLAWFGFWRSGCVCPIGGIQNIVLGLTDSSYAVPITVIAFVCLPLVVALLFGRTYCAAVCPHGALQDLVLVRPVRVPKWLEATLGLFPHLYLGLAVLLAATGSMFIICRYDPLVSFFRLTGSREMLIMGFLFLLVGAFIGRPYCRFVCPFGALLGLLSRVAVRTVTITPDRCVHCAQSPRPLAC